MESTITDRSIEEGVRICPGRLADWAQHEVVTVDEKFSRELDFGPQAARTLNMTFGKLAPLARAMTLGSFALQAPLFIKN